MENDTNPRPSLPVKHGGGPLFAAMNDLRAQRQADRLERLMELTGVITDKRIDEAQDLIRLMLGDLVPTRDQAAALVERTRAALHRAEQQLATMDAGIASLGAAAQELKVRRGQSAHPGHCGPKKA